MKEIPDGRDIQRIEEFLDLWGKIRIIKNNFNEAAFKVLGVAVWGNSDFPRCGARFTLDNGGYSDCGGFRESNSRDANLADVIIRIEDEKVKLKLWGKFIKVVRKLYDVQGIHLLERAGDLERLFQVFKHDLQEMDDDGYFSKDTDFETRIPFIILQDLAVNFMKHENKMDMIHEPEKLRESAKELIIYFTKLATPEVIKKCNYELTYCVELFLHYEWPIPKTLMGAAKYLLERDQKELQGEKEIFEEISRKLRKHMKAIRAAMPKN